MSVLVISIVIAVYVLVGFIGHLILNNALAGISSSSGGTPMKDLAKSTLFWPFYILRIILLKMLH
jgi:hypothetical protein